MFYSLSIIIPAYNEEDAIVSIIERSLAARQHIITNTLVKDVEIIVVSDGSVDKTPELAKQFEPQIKLIAYVPNKGYGAAIKTGFNEASGDLVSFLDADGTCDPLFFSDMINRMEEENADIVIGSRMGKQSKMPGIRRLGNTIFVNLIKILSKQELTDSASGMRVIKKDKLSRIYPLPDGLHFTPAMSVKALFDSNLKISEVDMTYEERVGESKLSVLKDGFRFLRVIIEAALGYNSFRIFAINAVLLLFIAGYYSIEPLIYYFNNTALEEWMIYRMITISTLTTSGIILLIIGRVIQTLSDIANAQNHSSESIIRKSTNFLFIRFGLFLSVFFAIIGLVILWNGIETYIESGQVFIHWSRVLLGAQAFTLSIVSFASGGFAVGLRYLKDKLLYNLKKQDN
ncbi:glycosyltransferase family 2 protein [bacterium]|nr:MAG: glycosyltransferase family 2 protein [bacterium]